MPLLSSAPHCDAFAMIRCAIPWRYCALLCRGGGAVGCAMPMHCEARHRFADALVGVDMECQGCGVRFIAMGSQAYAGQRKVLRSLCLGSTCLCRGRLWIGRLCRCCAEIRHAGPPQSIAPACLRTAVLDSAVAYSSSCQVNRPLPELRHWPRPRRAP